MNAPNKSVVAAAINDLSDRLMTDEGISVHDMDGMAKASFAATEMVAKQLARLGMALKDAEQLAEDATTSGGSTTKESTQLTEDAYRNRFAGVPVATGQSPSSNAEAAPAVPAAQTAPAGAGTGAATTLAPQEAADIVHAAEEAADRQAAPIATAMAAPAIVIPLAEEQREMIAHEVVWKNVSEVFPLIDAADPMFDFKIPYVNWDGRHTDVPDTDLGYNMDIEHLHTMLYSVAERITTNLVGPHGCGKTEFVAQIASRLGFPLIVMPMDGQMNRTHLFGQHRLVSTAHGPRTYFREGILPRGMAEPGFLLFDEVDRGISDIQYACHSVYLGKGLTLLEDDGRHIPCHEFNRIFATANTKGRGSMDGMYLAAEEMSEASRDRLTLWIDMDYQPIAEDVAVLKAKMPRIKDEEALIIAELASQIRLAFVGNQISQTCSMRQQLETARFFMFMAKNESDTDRRSAMLRHAITRVIKGRASEQDGNKIDTFLLTLLPPVGTSLF